MVAFINSVLGSVHAHPREWLTAALLVGWALNWVLGVGDAIARGTFAMSQLGRIIKTQLASVEALAVFGAYSIGFVGLAAAAALQAYKQGFVDPSAVAFLADRLLDIGAGAAGLYAVAIWHEVVFKQALDIVDALYARLSGRKPGAPRNTASIPWWVGLLERELARG